MYISTHVKKEQNDTYNEKQTPRAYSGFPGGSDGKESAYNVGDLVQSLVGKIPWRRERQPTSVCLLGESNRQRSLVGYNP